MDGELFSKSSDFREGRRIWGWGKLQIADWKLQIAKCKMQNAKWGWGDVRFVVW
jgi:hypothetical protein